MGRICIYFISYAEVIFFFFTLSYHHYYLYNCNISTLYYHQRNVCAWPWCDRRKIRSWGIRWVTSPMSQGEVRIWGIKWLRPANPIYRARWDQAVRGSYFFLPVNVRSIYEATDEVCLTCWSRWGQVVRDWASELPHQLHLIQLEPGVFFQHLKN